MKIRLLFSVLILAVSCNVFAQKNQNRSAKIEEMKAKRIAYVFQEAGLTADEAEKVLPLYNEYKQKSWELGKERATILKGIPASESEYEKAVEKYIGFQQREADLINEYSNKFRQVISAEKLFKLYAAEWKFLQRKMVAPQTKHQ